MKTSRLVPTQYDENEPGDQNVTSALAYDVNSELHQTGDFAIADTLLPIINTDRSLFALPPRDKLCGDENAYSRRMFVCSESALSWC